MTQDLLKVLKVRLAGVKDRTELAEVARESGVPIHTLLKIVSGETADPRVSTVQALLRYFDVQKASEGVKS